MSTLYENLRHDINQTKFTPLHEMEAGFNYRLIGGQLKGGEDQLKYALVNIWPFYW